ncbi:rhomboid family intramembrane serine protease [Litorihabitans aurantiacus]|uniref:Rhomboid family intramembrane serine protease n=1 Tax=Litorihabitans aurantiacus TaxID=1930061 RepID=A0AA37XHQ8_9MICO|nr:rhomboid family intramembrane serine protease [Litorihabitans aurantiacus]GMA33142.1 rhomboid family intramembrane serine protease [Litorihabitans aurantiacus]
MTDTFRTRPPAAGRARITGETLRSAAVAIGVLAALMVVLQVLNTLTGNALTQHLGIRPRSGEGLLGIVMAPLLHGSWAHLGANLVLVLILGFLLMLGGARQFVAVTGVVWLVSGLGIWLTAPRGSVTIGASVLVFGWLAHLVVRGFFTRDVWQIVLGVVLLALWGSMFWTGIAGAAFGPGAVSWQGHLFGAIGGVLAAVMVARADGGARRPLLQRR